MIFAHEVQTIDAELLSDIVSISKTTLLNWEKTGKVFPIFDVDGKKNTKYRISLNLKRFNICWGLTGKKNKRHCP